MPCRAAWSLGLFVSTALIFFAASMSSADQSTALLDLAALSNNTLVGWNAANVSRICEWQYVTCDSDGRIIELHLDGDDSTGIAILTGSLPQSIANLTSLRNLFLQHNYIYGDFPPSIFTLPNITYIFIHNTGLTVSFPQNISRSIQNLNVAHTKVISPIPDANWAEMLILDFEATGINCPLPASFVSHFRGGGSMIECSLYFNNLTIDANNMICGQIHSSNVTCRTSPHAYRARYFPTDDTVQPNIYSTRLSNFTLEFTEDEVMIFATYPRRGVLREYRREYLSFHLMPIANTYGADFQRKFETFDRPYWNRSAIIEEPNRVKANTTNTNSLITEFIFDALPDSNGGLFIKVSVAVYNLGHRWTPQPGREQKVSLFYVFNIRVSHSPTQGEALSCRRGVLGASSCNSSVASLETIIDITSASSVIRVLTKTAQIDYKYYIKGSVDGLPLYSNNASIFVPRLPFPLPSSRWLEANRIGGFTVLSNFSNAEQTFSAPIEILVPEFQNVFYFDPDISITLLFDPNDNVAPEASDPGVIATTSVGLIVGLVVGGVVILAAVTLFATVVFPYLKQRDTPKKAELDENPSESSERPKSGWTKSNTPKTQ